MHAPLIACFVRMQLICYLGLADSIEVHSDGSEGVSTEAL